MNGSASSLDSSARLRGEEKAGSTSKAAVGPSFAAVFDSHFSYVARTLRRLGVSERDSLDVAQEVFVVVLRKLADFDTERPLKPWLFGIAARVARDYRRLARHRREQLGAGDETAALEGDVETRAPDETLERHEAQELVLKILAQMEDDHREIFILRELEEQRMPVVADTLGVPLQTAYSRAKRAKAVFEALARRHLGKVAP